MKKLILLLALSIAAFYSPAQTFDLGFNIGTGFSSGFATGMPCEVRAILSQSCQECDDN